MKLGVMTLGAYRLTIVISFWCIAPFISVTCSSFSHLNSIGLKSTLSDNRNTVLIAVILLPVFGVHLLGKNLFFFFFLLPSFYSKPVFISVNKMGSCNRFSDLPF
jgi:hypothetical protein